MVKNNFKVVGFPTHKDELCSSFTTDELSHGISVGVEWAKVFRKVVITDMKAGRTAWVAVDGEVVVGGLNGN